MKIYHSYIYICLTMIFLLLAFPGYPLAHSSLEKTSPISGAELEEIPKSIEVWFEDPVTAYSNSIELIVNGKKQSIIARKDPENDKHLIATVPDSLSAGKYDAEIKAISLDGFVIREKISFSVSEQIAKNPASPLKLIKQVPADGEIVKGNGGRIELWFNKPAELTAIGLFDDQQGNIQLKQPVVDPKDPKHITVDAGEELETGTYQVTWYARPAESANANIPDILDVYYFAVKEFTPIKEVKNGEQIKRSWFPDMGWKQAGYWFWFTGVLILFGGSLTARITRHNPVYWSRWKRVSFYMLLVTISGMITVIFYQKSGLGNINWNEFFSLKYVFLPIIQIVLLILGYKLEKLQPWIYGTALLFLPFIAGHSTYPRYGGPITIMANELHLVAVSVWFGGLFAMITIPPKDQFLDFLKLVGLKFSKRAFWSMVIIIFTGIYMTLQLVPSFSFASFLGSQWGKAVLAKIGITCVIVALGLAQRRTIKQMTIMVMGRFRGRLKVELLYSVFILLFASILVVATPTTAEQGVYLEEASTQDNGVSVKLTPFFVGVNEMTLLFEEEVESVNVNLSMPPSFDVNIDAFKINKNTFKLTGNLLHTPGTMMMDVKAAAKDGKLLKYRYRIVVPGEKQLNE